VLAQQKTFASKRRPQQHWHLKQHIQDVLMWQSAKVPLTVLLSPKCWCAKAASMGTPYTASFTHMTGTGGLAMTTATGMTL
jgi:hypothetical protein